MTMTTDTVYAALRDAMASLFEIAPHRITPDADLYTDLEIDSIDAIDLMDHIRTQTGFKLSADDFRSVRTVRDVVDAVILRSTRSGPLSGDGPADSA